MCIRDRKELAQKYRDELIEAIAENDEELMMKYLDGEELTMAEMKAAIRKETIANTIAVSYTHLVPPAPPLAVASAPA